MARACLKCGHENPDDVDFCEQCGEYVRWELSGVRQAVPAPPPAAPPVAPPSPAQAPGQPEAPAVAAPPPAQAVPPQPPPVAPAAAPPPEVAPPPATDGAAYEEAPTIEEAGPEQPLEPDGSVVVTLRLPEDDSATGGEVTGRVEAGATTTLVALVRNQSGIVDNYDLHVEGLPDGWWTISPSTVYLVPYGAAGGEYEQEVVVTLHPPRAAEAEARTWPIRIVAVSKANGVPAGLATAGLDITPYHELEAEMRPERTSGRKRAQFAIAVRNRANAPVDVQLAGVDPDNEMRFSFQKPRFTVAPGRRNGSAIMVIPPKPALVGRPVQRRFEINSTVIGSETGALPKAAYLTQKPWIPAWALLILPLLLIAGIAAYLLWPRTATVPELTGKDMFAAQQLLDEAGLTLGNVTESPTDKSPAGTILKQSPAAGEEVDKESAVSLERAVATGRGEVPNLVGMTIAEADKAARAGGFTLAAAEPSDPAKDKIASQTPTAGEVAEQAQPIQILFAAGGETVPTETTTPTDPAKPPPPPPSGPTEAVPSLAGLAAGAAVAALKDAGFKPVFGPREFSPTVKEGELIRREPPGDEIPEGGTVTLVYSKGYPELLFEQAGNVFLANAVDGKKPKAIANSDRVEEEIAINPTGTLIAYRSGTATAGEIWIVRPNDPLSAKQLTETGFDDGRPAFSPNGKVVAFTRGKADDPAADRNLCFVLTRGGKAACIDDPNRTLSRPVWSPDGRVILAVARGAQEQQEELIRYASPTPNSPQPAKWRDLGYATDAFHGDDANDTVVHAAFSNDGRLALTSNWGTGFVHVQIAAYKDGVIEKPKPVPDIRGCELTWRADSLELLLAQRGEDCDDSTGELIRVDPAKPSEQKALRPGNSPAWSPVVLGKK
jgi:beta-lactam-binding protein with PASTA domain